MGAKNEFIEDLNNRFFKGELSKQFQDRLELLPINRPDVLAFVERMFGFMHKASIPATDLSTLQGEILGTLLARILPGAWDGKIPPITIPGRHAAMDQYIKAWQGANQESKSMLDIGCGFPPYTTLETGTHFPEWNMLGVDPSLPKYLIYDDQGNYATLDKNKQTVYFQPAIPSVENWNALLGDSAATKNRFEKLLEELLVQPNTDSDAFPRLEIDPIENYATDKISFKQGGIGQVDIASKDVIRCFNVLFYFNDDFYKDALQWFATNTNQDGIVLIGGNWAGSTESYYNVYQKNGDDLVNKEFAFSLDCISPVGIVTWYSNFDDDRQKAELIKYIGALRRDAAFMEEFYAFHDAQRATYKLCPRDSDGYYGLVDPAIGPQELWGLANTILSELNASGLGQKAVEVLKNSGFNARINEVGHVAVVFN